MSKPSTTTRSKTATTSDDVPLGTEWYADMSPNVRRYIEQKNPQTTADLVALLTEAVGYLGKRLGGTS